MIRRLDLLTGLSDTDGGGANLAASTGTSVSNQTGGTDNTFGPWVEVITSSAVDANYLLLHGNGGNADNSRFNINIGIGPAGSELIAVEGISIRSSTYDFSVVVPIQIRRGDRVAIQSGAPIDYRVVRCIVDAVQHRGFAHRSLISSSYTETGRLPNVVDQAITIPTADNTWGAWSQLVSSMPDEGDIFIGAFTAPDKTNGEGNENILVQLGIGAAGAEVPISEPVHQYFDSYVEGWGAFVISTRIPKGERLSVRIQSDNIVAHTPYTLRMAHTIFGE